MKRETLRDYSGTKYSTQQHLPLRTGRQGVGLGLCVVKPTWRWCEWTQDKNLFWPKGKKLDHCWSLVGVQTMKVNPDNPSELSFKEVLKDKNASRFFPVLTAKAGSEGRETISSLQQARVLNANKGSRAGQNLSGEQDLQEPQDVGPGNPWTVPLEDKKEKVGWAKRSSISHLVCQSP